MNIDRIDFISSYCDRWCERCAFNMRCSAYAVEVAAAMCDDPAQALELAVGIPPEPHGGEIERPWLKDIANVAAGEEEDAEGDREDEERERRARESPVVQLSHAVTTLAFQWLRERREAVAAGADEVIREAIAVASHDAILIGTKIERAIRGLPLVSDSGPCLRQDDEHPIQNDWNGSAKVALISIGRSEEAWRTLAQSTGDEVPAAIAAALSDLRAQVEEAFPHARQFVRPGFDQPGI